MTPIAIIRVLLFICLVLAGAIVSYPASKYRFQRKATSRLLRFFCRIILFIFGFYSIPITNLNDDNMEHNEISKLARTTRSFKPGALSKKPLLPVVFI